MDQHPDEDRELTAMEKLTVVATYAALVQAMSTGTPR